MPLHDPNRRQLIATTTAAAMALTAARSASICPTSDADFIRSLECLFDNGGLAARHALAGGVRPEQLVTIIQPSHVGPLLTAALMFETPRGFRTFRPHGEDL